MHGDLFKINSPTVAIERPGNNAKVIHIPAGSAIRVVKEASGADLLVGVEWNGRALSMFARDLVERGERVQDGLADS
jgi:hypothetical protein